jgi:hypothetical protein
LPNVASKFNAWPEPELCLAIWVTGMNATSTFKEDDLLQACSQNSLAPSAGKASHCNNTPAMLIKSAGSERLFATFQLCYSSDPHQIPSSSFGSITPVSAAGYMARILSWQEFF